MQPGQDVDHAESGDRAAHGWVFEKSDQTGRVQFAGDEVEEKVVVPKRRPGQYQQQNAQLEADQDIDDYGDFGRHQNFISYCKLAR